MSVDLFLIPLSERFSRAEIIAAFAPFVTDTDYGALVKYDRMNSSDLYFKLSEDGTTESVCVNRPCGDPRLFESLFGFMRKHRACLASGDCDPPYRVTSEDDLRLAHAAIPDIEGQVTVVDSADRLLA